MKGLATVAVVGRPNVGKSTLINRIVGSREAIVHDEPGVTRDRLQLRADWNGRDFLLIDTGGILPGSDDEILQSIQKQAEAAIEEADVILFLVDGKAGINPAEEDIANILRQSRKPVVLAVNKADNPEIESSLTAEFYALGLGDPLPISAVHGFGIGDLLDVIVDALPPPIEVEETQELKLAIVGRPNVGKSSLTNALLGTERVIVSPVAGTTRDAIDSVLVRDGERYLLIDTAGIRRKSKVDYGVEAFSVVRSLKAIERADVVILMIDAVDGVTEQDKKIAAMADENGKSLILAINKWDLVEKDTYTMNQFREDITRDLHFVSYAPMVFISALTKQRIFQIIDLAKKVDSEAHRRVTTGLLNQVILEAQAMNQPPMMHGKRLRIYYATQFGVAPPSFRLFVNSPQNMTDSYKRYLENKLREAFGFSGTPIRIFMRPRREKE